MVKQNGGLEVEAIAPHVLEYVAAYGPSSVAGILSYVQEQHDGLARKWHVAAAITHLIREKKVELYDDCESFVAS
jgi:hypothetical protein